MRKKKKGQSHRSSHRSGENPNESAEIEKPDLSLFPSRTYGPFMFKDAYYKPASEIMGLIEETVEGVV
jgi:hypothetical protein